MEDILTINYHLTTDDYIENQLYMASKSETIRKKMHLNRNLVALLYLGIGLWSLFQDNLLWVGITFTLFSILWYVYYLGYAVKKYKKHVQQIVLEKFKGDLGSNVELTVDDEYIHYVDISGDGKIKKSEIDSITELKNVLLIQMQTQIALIIPKRDLPDIKRFVDSLKTSEVEYLDHSNWTWK